MIYIIIILKALDRRVSFLSSNTVMLRVYPKHIQTRDTCNCSHDQPDAPSSSHQNMHELEHTLAAEGFPYYIIISGIIILIVSLLEP